MRLQDPLIINLACTGAVITREQHPALPVTPEEIADEVSRCLPLGVGMVHLHARAHPDNPGPLADRFARLLRAIRVRPGGREAVLCVSTSARSGDSLQERLAVLELDGVVKPDMASLTLSSHNFQDGPSIHPLATVRELARVMLERGIKPELEIFDLGMVNVAKRLIVEGLLTPPYYFNVFIGNMAGVQLDLAQVGIVLSSLPQPAVVALAGIGRFQLAANHIALVMAHGVRTGLEDNIHFDIGRTQLADNSGLVGRIAELAGILGRPLATSGWVREILELPKGEGEGII